VVDSSYFYSNKKLLFKHQCLHSSTIPPYFWASQFIALQSVAQEDSILIGGSGAIDRLPVGEFLKQQAQFQRIAVLADPAKVSSFTDTQVRGSNSWWGHFWMWVPMQVRL
jgi:hypothetical protein